jgi:threonine synthase
MNAHFNYLSHLACSVCGYQYQADQLQTISPCCSRPLLAQYDLAAVARNVRRNELVQRETNMWRYHEAAATLAVYHMLLDTKFLTPEDETVLFFTGSGLSEIGTYV